VLDEDSAPLPPKKRGAQFSTNVCCGQTVAHLSYCWALVTSTFETAAPAALSSSFVLLFVAWNFQFTYRIPKSATATAAWTRHVLSSRRCFWYILCIWYRRFEALAFCYQLGCDPGPTYRDVQLLFTSRSRTERRPCLNSLARPLNVSDVYKLFWVFKIEDYHRDHLCETSPRTVDFERRCTVYYYVSISPYFKCR